MTEAEVALSLEPTPESKALRIHRVRTADNVKILMELADAFNEATRNSCPKTTSGLVEMQRLFAKLPRLLGST